MKYLVIARRRATVQTVARLSTPPKNMSTPNSRVAARIASISSLPEMGAGWASPTPSLMNR